MPQPYLKNGDFEADWQDQPDDEKYRCLVLVPGCPAVEKDVGNIFCPPHWRFWFVHNPGTYDQPEGRDARSADRVRSGEKAYMWFTFHRSHDAGLYQQVRAGVGGLVHFSIYAHAWSNGLKEEDGGRPDDPTWSDGVEDDECWFTAGAWPHDTGDPWEDAKPNFTFQVGIDPTGGTDPLADTVIWGPGAHIYNGYCHKLEVEAEAQVDVVTVFVRSTTLWAFKHNDAYVDDAELTVDGRFYPQSDAEIVALNVGGRGDLVTLDARSSEGLTNVAFEMEAPDGEIVALPIYRMYRDTFGDHHWQAQFWPTLPGEHRATFSADGNVSDTVIFTVAGPPTPPDVSLSVEPQFPRVGDVVTAVAESTQPLSNARFEVVLDGKIYPFAVETESSEGSIHFYVTRFVVHDAMSHVVRFISDEAQVQMMLDVAEARGKPREQYERTYVLLPPGAGAEWVSAVIEARWDSDHWTIGGSADDAGIGDLDVRRVIAVNPGAWPGPQTLAGFFAEFYPGVEYVPVEAQTPEELVAYLGNLPR